MKVLVACEESQTICIEFRKLWIEAYSCDIQPCTWWHPERHIQGDAIEEAYSGKYDMMIAHPPCTHLSSSWARHFAKKIADGRQQEWIDFFMLLVNAPIEKIAIENPVWVMSTKYRKPDQIIQPRQFWDEAQKSTCLWLKNLPPLKPTNIVSKWEFYVSPSGKRLPMRYNKAKGNRWSERSKTFPWIAKAIAQQRSEYIIQSENI